MKKLIEQLRDYWLENGWTVMMLVGAALLAVLIIFQISKT